MAMNLIMYDIMRKTPSKMLIAAFSFIIIGKLSPRFKVLKAYKEYSFKEVDDRRTLSFELANQSVSAMRNL